MSSNAFYDILKSIMGRFLALFFVLSPIIAHADLEPSCEDLLGPRSVFRLTRPEDSKIQHSAKRLVEHLVGLSKILKIYEGHKHEVTSPESFWKTVLKAFNINLDVTGELDHIPKSGALIVASNHPFGLLDGVTLAHLVSQRRDDYMILGNAVLSKIPEIQSRIIPLEILNGSKENKALSRKINQASIERATQHLKEGGALIVFPSGTVSTTQGGIFGLSGEVIEEPWRNTVGRLIERTRASSLPVFFEGQNSLSFHLASRLKQPLKELLRVALLPSELLKKSGETLRVVIGQEIPAIKFYAEANHSPLAKEKLFTEMLKSEVLKLKNQSLVAETQTSQRVMSPIDVELSPGEVKDFLGKGLRNNSIEILVKKESFEVYRVSGKDLTPKMLNHLGVLREKTFRQVGEGSGKSSDHDEFDLRYEHLLLWSKSTQSIVGAYRLGSFEEARRTGNYGLMYTHQQFNYTPDFFKNFNGGMFEMGRSFIVQEFQAEPLALASLWSAIGEHLVNNEAYRYLCGPVSLSGDYTDLSKTLIKAYYLKHHGDEKGLRKLIRPHHLFPGEVPLSPEVLEDFLSQTQKPSDLDRMIRSLEKNGRGIPPLIKHYPGLLGAKFIEASVDPDFNTLDFLICVDLKHMNPRKAQNFIGEKAQGLHDRFKSVD